MVEKLTIEIYCRGHFIGKNVTIHASKQFLLNGHYNPSVRIIDLVSHTTYVVCVNFIHKWRDLQFKVDSERQIFEKLLMANLFTLRVFARNLLRCLAWDSNPGFSSNKPTHYLLDHCDFNTIAIPRKIIFLIETVYIDATR